MIRLTDMIDIKRLQSVQDCFSNATGLSTVIIDVEGNRITEVSNYNQVCKLVSSTERGAELCRLSNQSRTLKSSQSDDPIYHQCLTAGFVDASAPIIVEGKTIAYWLVGQCNVLGVTGDQIRERAKELGADPDEVLEAFKQTPSMKEERFKTILDLLYQIANSISEMANNNRILSEEIKIRNKTAKALEETEALNRALLDASPNVSFLMDLDGNVLALNNGLARSVDVSFNDLKGKHLSDFLPPDVLKTRWEFVRLAIKTKEPVRFEDMRDDRYMEHYVYPVTDTEDKVIAVAINAFDITEQKRIQLELNKSREVLEEQVRNRTRQLEDLNRTLIIERETLRRKNAALQELISHIDDGKKEMSLQISANINRVALPIIEHLSRIMPQAEKRYFSMLKKSLENVTSPFLNSLESKYSQLTPRELEICNLIKNGFRTKEIALSLKSSEQTVLTQRKIIRKKLGISNKQINLSLFLRKFNNGGNNN